MGDDNTWKSYSSMYEGWTYWTPEKEEKPLTKRCTCGSNIAMGYEAPEEFHSDWCELKGKVDANCETSKRRDND